MDKEWVYLIVILLYFAVLFIISKITSKHSNNQTFFTANRQSPWYLVAFGMIGASLSGVTFISVPGTVKLQGLTYMQIVFGYFIGYWIVAHLLLPVYYRINQASIYGYLEERFGPYTRITGSWFFIISRLLGSSARMYLAISVLHYILFRHFGWPFQFTAIAGILLIWLYTYRGGIKTIVFTDTLQTFFMLLSVVLMLVFLFSTFQQHDIDLYSTITQSKMFKIFEYHNFKSPNFFLKQILAGMLITITMTGLDQDMMQKNLTCKNLKEAQKNMHWFSVILVVVNFLFLMLGLMMYLYVDFFEIHIPEKTDMVLPYLATGGYFPFYLGVVFLLGLIAAAYSSADSTLTALTTSFYHDILHYDQKKQHDGERMRKIIHIVFTLVTVLVILFFYYFNETNVLDLILNMAGYTYGPLLGLYFCGIFLKLTPKDKWVPFVCNVAPVFGYIIQNNTENWFNGYKVGYEILAINGMITVVGLWILHKVNSNQISSVK